MRVLIDTGNSEVDISDNQYHSRHVFVLVERALMSLGYTEEEIKEYFVGKKEDKYV